MVEYTMIEREPGAFQQPVSLHIKATESSDPKVVAGTRAFWQTYSDEGIEPSDLSTQFRLHVYYGMSFGAARLELHRRGDHARSKQTYQRLQEILDFLSALYNCGGCWRQQ